LDLDAIKFNVQHLKKKAGTDVLAVVKADAYGHGLIPVAKKRRYRRVLRILESRSLKKLSRSVKMESQRPSWLESVQPGSDFESAITLDIDLAAASIKAL
jgi:alanine racemase